MGLAASKVELVEDESRITRRKELTIERRVVSDSKRRSSFRASNDRHPDFALDESQSRSTESTQGSPEIGMYPTNSKAQWGIRRASYGPGTGVSFGRAKCFRRQSGNGSGALTVKENKNENEALPPPYLEFQQTSMLPPLSACGTSQSGRTAPVPVVRTQKGQPTTQLDRWESYSDGDTHDSEVRLDELERMYDMRTWDMYLRITEARKNKPQPTMIPHAGPSSQQQRQQRSNILSADGFHYFAPGETALDDPEMPTGDPSQSDEMFFGDLE